MNREKIMDENQHLKRHVYCDGGYDGDDCKWVGVNGELVAKDKLRCPKCGSSQIRYLVAETPASVQ